MEIQELNKKLRKHLKDSGHYGIGWRVLYVGNILSATCKEHDIRFEEVLAAQRFIESAMSESLQKTRVHFSNNDTYGAVINWAF